MIKQIRTFLFFVALISISACETSNQIDLKKNQSENEVKGVALLSDQRKSEISLNGDEQELTSLRETNEWKNLSKELLVRISSSKKPTLTKFNNSNVAIISFNLTTKLNYESLVFYILEDRVIPAIAKSAQEGQLNHFSVNDLFGKTYFEFYTNAENKLGKFSVKNNLPFSNLLQQGRSANSLGGEPISGDATCPKKTTNFGDCMLCAINECTGDWVCAVVCAIESAACLAGFALACAVG